MFVASSALPQNPDELKAFVLALQAGYAELENRNEELARERTALKTELYAKTLHIEKLKAQLAALKHARYGRSSERLDQEIHQLELTINALEASPTLPPPPMPRPSAKPSREAAPGEPSRPMRKALPEHLPRERVEHAPACVCPECGSTRLTRIGVDEREVLEYTPSHFKVIVHARPKMSCRECETITQPPLPAHAHAGMNPSCHPAPRRGSGFPRPRGDEPAPSVHLRQVWQVSSAHAGMNLATSAPCRCGHRFPRPRGDEPSKGEEEPSIFTFPPPTRG